MDARDITAKLGGRWSGGSGQAPCPVCQPERRQDQIGLSIRQGNTKLLVYCHKSECDYREIVNAIGLERTVALPDRKAMRKQQRENEAQRIKKLEAAEATWDKALPIEGTIAEKYLRNRGITCPLPSTLRFAPNIRHVPTASWACAMIAQVQPTGAVHRTYFSKSGSRLEKSPKMMLGTCLGGAVRLSGGDGPIVVCEGIETGLSLLTGPLSGSFQVWAALSAAGMRGLELPKRPGRLIVATDGDDAGRSAGNALAQRAYSKGWRVQLKPAPDGMDWNDVLNQAGKAA